MYSAISLWNKLSEELKNEESLERFKAGLRKWVIANIPIKPVSKFQKFGERVVPKQVITPQKTRAGQQDIRTFFSSRLTTIGQGTLLTSGEAPPQPTDRPPPACTKEERRQGITRYFRPVVPPDCSTQTMDIENFGELFDKD